MKKEKTSGRIHYILDSEMEVEYGIRFSLKKNL